jgi:hypothetical protein
MRAEQSIQIANAVRISGAEKKDYTKWIKDTLQVNKKQKINHPKFRKM